MSSLCGIISSSISDTCYLPCPFLIFYLDSFFSRKNVCQFLITLRKCSKCKRWSTLKKKPIEKVEAMQKKSRCYFKIRMNTFLTLIVSWIRKNLNNGIWLKFSRNAQRIKLRSILLVMFFDELKLIQICFCFIKRTRARLRNNKYTCFRD